MINRLCIFKIKIKTTKYSPYGKCQHRIWKVNKIKLGFRCWERLKMQKRHNWIIQSWWFKGYHWSAGCVCLSQHFIMEPNVPGCSEQIQYLTDCLYFMPVSDTWTSIYVNKVAAQHFCIVLFIWMSEKERSRDGEKEDLFSVHDCTPPVAPVAKAGPGWSQEPIVSARSPTMVTGAHVGWHCLRQWFYLLCHSAGHPTYFLKKNTRFLFGQIEKKIFGHFK